MDKVISVIQVVLPIFVAVFLGVFARKKAMFTHAEIEAFQRFVVKFCFPCLLFRSCLTAELGPEAFSGLVLPALLLFTAIWGFKVGKKWFPYHNIPFIFCCKETGMLGIPLFMILFGADQAYRVGILDVTQAIVVFPVIAILGAAPGTAASPKAVVKEMFKSPLILMSLTGLVLNLTGIWDWMQMVKIDGIVTDTFSYLSQPVSMMMLFCVGYNFTLNAENKQEIFRIVAVHTVMFIGVGLLLQGALFFFPNVDELTRWAMVMYMILPSSFMVPSLGRTEKDANITSGVCSVLTAITLVAFCIIAIIVS